MPDESRASEVEGADTAWLDEHVELDLTGHDAREHPGTNSSAPATVDGKSDRAAELASDHWRERAVLWRERAVAAELVAKMLQRNLDDLRANLDDLRREAQAVERAQQLEAAQRPSGQITPWRRFVRDVYDKYLR